VKDRIATWRELRLVILVFVLGLTLWWLSGLGGRLALRRPSLRVDLVQTYTT